jgi:hypothetical protein
VATKNHLSNYLILIFSFIRGYTLRGRDTSLITAATAKIIATELVVAIARIITTRFIVAIAGVITRIITTRFIVAIAGVVARIIPTRFIVVVVAIVTVTGWRIVRFYKVCSNPGTISNLLPVIVAFHDRPKGSTTVPSDNPPMRR